MHFFCFCSLFSCFCFCKGGRSKRSTLVTYGFLSNRSIFTGAFPHKIQPWTCFQFWHSKARTFSTMTFSRTKCCQTWNKFQICVFWNVKIRCYRNSTFQIVLTFSLESSYGAYNTSLNVKVETHVAHDSL